MPITRIMGYIESVFELSEEFMKEPRQVSIDTKSLNALAKRMKDEGKSEFPSQASSPLYTPKLELLASSINYCYWYGRAGLYPASGGSFTMYNIVDDNIDKKREGVQLGEIEDIALELTEKRFPLLEQRIRHLYETLEFPVESLVGKVSHGYSAEECLTDICETMPGFASDLFLKRAILYIIQLNRALGWFEEDMDKIFIPSDYQVPRVLRGFNVIKYGPRLTKDVDKGGVLIPEGSQAECEIRAATILACKALSDSTGWNASEIDCWLWMRRKEAPGNHHLTVTTAY